MQGNAAATAKVLLTAEDRTAGVFAAVQKNLSGIGAAASNITGVVSGIGGAAVITAIGNAVRTTANYGDEMSKLAQRAGVTTEAISELAFAARLADVDNNTLARGLRELGNDAAEGGEKLKELGISLADASGNAKTSDALFLEVADRLAAIEDPAQRAAMAAKVFGDRIGPELIPLLAGGAKGLREAAAEARNFGKVVSGEAGKAAEEFNDNLTRLNEVAGGLSITLANRLLPAFNALLKGLLDLPKTASLAGLASDVVSLDKQLKALESRKSGPFNFASNLDEQIATTREKLAEAKRVFNAADTGRPLAPGGGRGFVNPASALQPPRLLTKEEKDAQKEEAKRLAEEAKRAQSEAQRRLADSRKEAEDFQRYLQDLDNDRFDYLAKRNDDLLREKETQEADHLAFLKGFDDARFDYIAQRNEDMLRAEEEAKKQRLQAIGEFNKTLGDDLKGALSAAFRDTKDPLRAFGDALANVVFTRVSGSLATSIADGLLGSGGSGGSVGSFLTSLLSFDGGGYTGSGPRAGGMDGRGGFLAMVHPNETIVDHTRGQSAGAPIVVNISNSIGSVASQGDVVAGMQTVRAQIIGELQRSARYGGGMA